MGGLVVATALTLFFLPALYAAWFRVKKPAPFNSGVRSDGPDPMHPDGTMKKALNVRKSSKIPG
jgi:hypothetical protein